MVAWWLAACRTPPTLGSDPPPPAVEDTGLLDTGPLDAVPRPVDLGPTRAVHDGDYFVAALEAVDAAQRELRVAEYLVVRGPRVDELLGAIEDAAKRGVAVRVLADQEGDDAESALAVLSAAGAQTAFDSRNTTLHTKLIVADDVALVGSHNFTDAALSRNHEGSTFVADAEVASAYAAWFDALWADPEADPAPATWTRTDLVPLADREVTDALVACMNAAAERVDLVLYAATWDDRYPGSDVDLALGALEAAHGRGVAVRVVLDGSPWVEDNGVNDAAVARLRAAGVPVWRTGAWVTTHAKALRCDDATVVGDANWSYSGLELYHGTSLGSTLPELAAGHEALFDAAMAEATPVP